MNIFPGACRQWWITLQLFDVDFHADKKKALFVKIVVIIAL
jgi:hypothetical protein